MVTDLKTFTLLNESMRQGKAYVASGKISEDVLKEIEQIDPTQTKKYVGWIAKQYIASQFDVKSLASYIEEYNTFVDKNKADVKDINSFKSVDELKSYVDNLNEQGTASLKELENDYDIVMDTPDVYIACPHTHEASRKLGLTTFAHRNDGTDCAWCTTYKNKARFRDYYYKNNVTFYYIWVKNEKFVTQLGGQVFSKMAFAVLPDGQIDAYDADDRRMNSTKVDLVRKLLGI